MKLAFAEDLVDRLNDIVTRQQGQIDRLLNDVRQLRQVAAAGEPAAGLPQPARRGLPTPLLKLRQPAPPR